MLSFSVPIAVSSIPFSFNRRSLLRQYVPLLYSVCSHLAYEAFRSLQIIYLLSVRSYAQLLLRELLDDLVIHSRLLIIGY